LHKTLISLSVSLFLALGGCASDGNAGAEKSVAASAAESAVPLAAAVQEEGTEEQAPALPEEPAPPPSPTPESFISLSGAALQELLGEPALKTREPPAQIWRYSLDPCTVFFFLYETDPGAQSVRHVDVTVPGDARVQPDLCLSGIVLPELSAGAPFEVPAEVPDASPEPAILPEPANPGD